MTGHLPGDDPRRAGLALLLAALLATACAPVGTPRDDGGATGDGLRIEGTLTDEGVECPALRGDDGELYTLTGGTGGFAPGDRVEVVATPVQISFCMQGTTVKVRQIQAAPGG